MNPTTLGPLETMRATPPALRNRARRLEAIAVLSGLVLCGVASPAAAVDGRTVEVINRGSQSAADLEIVFRGAGGSLDVPSAIFLDASSNCSRQRAIATPRVELLGEGKAKAIVEFLGPDGRKIRCLPPARGIAFKATTANGPLEVESGTWTDEGGNPTEAVRSGDVALLEPGADRQVLPPSRADGAWSPLLVHCACSSREEARLVGTKVARVPTFICAGLCDLRSGPVRTSVAGSVLTNECQQGFYFDSLIAGAEWREGVWKDVEGPAVNFRELGRSFLSAFAGKSVSATQGTASTASDQAPTAGRPVNPDGLAPCGSYPNPPALVFTPANRNVRVQFPSARKDLLLLRSPPSAIQFSRDGLIALVNPSEAGRAIGYRHASRRDLSVQESSLVEGLTQRVVLGIRPIAGHAKFRAWRVDFSRLKLASRHAVGDTARLFPWNSPDQSGGNQVISPKQDLLTLRADQGVSFDLYPFKVQKGPAPQVELAILDVIADITQAEPDRVVFELVLSGSGESRREIAFAGLGLQDGDGNGLVELPSGKSRIQGTLTVPPPAPTEMTGTTKLEPDELFVDRESALVTNAAYRVQIVTFEGDLTSRGALGFDAADDIELVARKGAVDLDGVVHMLAADRLLVESKLQGVRLAAPLAFPPELPGAVRSRNVLDIRARGADGRIEVAWVVLAARRIDVDARTSNSVVGDKGIVLGPGAVVTTDPAVSGAATAGDVTLRARGRIEVRDGAQVDSGRNLVFYTQTPGDVVCLSGGAVLEAGNGVGRIDFRGVKSTVWDDGTTVFRGTVLGGVAIGPCPAEESGD